jgi:hypothetical protein
MSLSERGFLLNFDFPKVARLRSDDLEITEKHIRSMFDRLPSGRAIEVYDIVDRMQLDVVTEIFFGESANSLNSEPPFREAADLLNRINTARMLFM